MKIKTSLGNLSIVKKDQYDNGYLRYNLRPIEVTPAEFLDSILNQKYHFIPGLISSQKNTSSEDIVGSQIIAFDFDNTNITKYTISKVTKFLDFIGIKPTACYHSFSSSRYHQKFRMIWILDTFLESKAYKKLLEILYVLFVSAGYDPGDKSNTSVCQMYKPGLKTAYRDDSKIYSASYIIEIFNFWYFIQSINNQQYISTQKKVNILEELQLDYHKKYGLIIDREPATSSNNVQYTYSESFQLVGIKRLTTLSIDEKGPLYNILGSHFTSDDSPKFNHIKHLERLSDDCKLWNLYINKEDDTTHDEFFLLYSIASCYKGGKMMYESNISSKKRKASIKSTKASERRLNKKYNSQRCSNKCRFYDTCKTRNPHYAARSINYIKTDVREETPKMDYLELRQEVSDDIRSQLWNPTHRYTIVKVPTGCGKTTSLLKYVKDDTIVALPTLKLVEEKDSEVELYNNPCMQSRFTWRGFPKSIFRTENENNATSELFDKGLITANALLDYFDKDEVAKASILRYFRDQRLIETHRGGPILTSHHKLMFFHNPQYNTVCFDEDPLNTIFIETTITSDKTIQKLYNETEGEIREYFGQFIKGKDYQLYTPHKISGTIDINEFISSHKYILKTLSDKVLPIFTSDFFQFENDGTITFVKNNIQKIKDLKYKNIIILSATADEKIYNEIFKGEDYKFVDLSVQFTPKTKPVQYTEYSFTRSSINGRKTELNTLIYPKLEENDIKSIISYKFCISDGCFFDSNYEQKLYFFNSLGTNKYTGQNLAIIGTPYPSMMTTSIYYHCIYNTSDFLKDYLWVNRQAFKKTQRIREENGCQYKTHHPSNNDAVNTIYFWLTGQEMDQAIGRFRPYEYEGKILVFSRYPVKFAEFKSIKDDKTNK